MEHKPLFSKQEGVGGGGYRGLGSLPLGCEDTLAWAACPPPQENLTQLNSVSFFLLLNKNPYNRNMAKLIFLCTYESFTG